MNILDLLNEADITPKRKAACHGGEYCSPCPFCKDGKDRFLIWPNRPNKDGSLQGGRYSCRVCGKYGDGINFLRELYGLSYKEACSKLRLEPKMQQYNTPSIRKEPDPPISNDPPSIWQEKAKLFVEWSHMQLMNNPNAMALVTARGFNIETIKRFKIGFNPGELVDGEIRDFFREREEWGLAPEFKEDGKLKKFWLPAGIVIPSLSSAGQIVKVKVRRSKWEEDDNLPKYIELSGSRQSPSIYGNTDLDTVLVLESELDAILCQQFASDLLFCVALGGSTKTLDMDTFQLIKSKSTVLFCPDFDDAGVLAFVKWRRKFPNTIRILTPEGKAPGDAFLAGVDLRAWIEENITSNIGDKN